MLRRDAWSWSIVVALACAVALTTATGSAALAHELPRAATDRTGTQCGARESRPLIGRFLAAFNRGDLRQLNLLIAPAAKFEKYAVRGSPGQRVGKAAAKRATLIRYFADRRRQSERLVLVRFGVSRLSPRRASFWFELLRSADDLKPATPYPGTGAITCDRRRGSIVAWQMAPNGEPSLPAPRTYTETCGLVGSWCQREPSTGGVPDALRRPLALPRVNVGGACPTTGGQRFDNGQFAGIALGEGPVQPLVAGGGPEVERGRVVFRPYPGRRGWYSTKSLWFARPEYQGPVLIHGRRLDGPEMIVFGEAPSLVEPQLGPGATLNGRDGWRQWPGGTWLRRPGCYAWQIDGSNFSHVIVIEAVFSASP